MNALDATALIARAMKHADPSGEKLTLRIPVVGRGSVGPAESVLVTSIDAGFDWDKGTLWVTPACQLTVLTSADVQAIHKSMSKGASWHAYQRHLELQAETKEARDMLDRAMALLAKACCSDKTCCPDGAAYDALLGDYNKAKGKR